MGIDEVDLPQPALSDSDRELRLDRRRLVQGIAAASLVAATLGAGRLTTAPSGGATGHLGALAHGAESQLSDINLAVDDVNSGQWLEAVLQVMMA
jgi:hypothetical protein